MLVGSRSSPGSHDGSSSAWYRTRSYMPVRALHDEVRDQLGHATLVLEVRPGRQREGERIARARQLAPGADGTRG